MVGTRRLDRFSIKPSQWILTQLYNPFHKSLQSSLNTIHSSTKPSTIPQTSSVLKSSFQGSSSNFNDIDPLHSFNMYSKMISILPILAAIFTSTTATPVSKRDTVGTTATLITYFVDEACSSDYDQAYQTLSDNQCRDLGQGSTTRSMALQNIAAPSDSTSCRMMVYTDESCATQAASWLQLSNSNTTCLQLSNTDLWATRSAMMVCE